MTEDPTLLRNRLFFSATWEMDVLTTISCGRGADARGPTTDRVISRRDLALSIRAPFFTGDIRPAGHLIPGHASQNLNLAGKWTTSINPVRSARAGNAANIFRVRSGARERARRVVVRRNDG